MLLIRPLSGCYSRAAALRMKLFCFLCGKNYNKPYMSETINLGNVLLLRVDIWLGLSSAEVGSDNPALMSSH